MNVFEQKINSASSELIQYCKRECADKTYQEINKFFGDEFTEACYEISVYNDYDEEDYQTIYTERKQAVDSILEEDGLSAEDKDDLQIAVYDLMRFTLEEQDGLIQGIVLQKFRERVINESQAHVNTHIDLKTYTERFSEVQDEELEAQAMVEEKAVFAEHLNKKLAPKQAAPNKKKI